MDKTQIEKMKEKHKAALVFWKSREGKKQRTALAEKLRNCKPPRKP